MTSGERRGRSQRWAVGGDDGRLQISLAGHDGGERGGKVAAGIGVVGQSEGHQQRAEVGIAQAQRAIVVRVARDDFGGVAGVVDQDLHGRDDDGDGVPIGWNIERARRRNELEQVEAGQVAGGVVEEHVLAAWIGCVDAGRVLAGVPLVDGGVELHARVAAEPGGLGDLVHDVARLVGLDRPVVLDGVGGEFAVGLVGAHELVSDANGVVGVLEEDGRVGLGVGAGAVIAGLISAKALASSLALHSMKSTMSGWSTLRMTILAARRVLPPDLMTPAKASKPRMKLSGPEACAAAGEQFHRSADARRGWCRCPSPT